MVRWQLQRYSFRLSSIESGKHYRLPAHCSQSKTTQSHVVCTSQAAIK